MTRPRSPTAARARRRSCASRGGGYPSPHDFWNDRGIVRILAVDWSGARSGARRVIWVAEARAGTIVRLESGRDREEVTRFLLAEARRDPELVVGLDFAFSV